MKQSFKLVAAMATVTAAMVGTTAPAYAAEEQFVPLLTYRTGSFAPLGIPGPMASRII